MSVTPIIDSILGEIADCGNASFSAAVPHQDQPIQIVLPAGEVEDACVDQAALSSARRIAQDLASTVEQALGFLATFRGFGGLARVRAIFSLQRIVTTSKAGRYWLEFRCSEDRHPEAIWRVEFESWIPTAQGRDD